MKTMNYSLVGLVLDNEGLEGYVLDNNNVKSVSGTMKNIDRNVVEQFLQCEGTVIAIKEKKGEPTLIAHNTIANETVEISGIGDHANTLIKIIQAGIAKKEQKEKDVGVVLLDHELIKETNKNIHTIRAGEIGIGEYRSLDFFGNPVNLMLGRHASNGKMNRVPIILERGEDDNINNKMNELVKWVNETAFKDRTHIWEDVAEFHSRFIQIHPFRDGNGRTVRLITNYLLLANNMPLINVAEGDKDEYLAKLNFSMVEPEKYNELKYQNERMVRYYEAIEKDVGKKTEENKYRPLVNFFKTHTVANCSDIVLSAINYNNENNSKLHCDEIILGNEL